jgi:ABC-type antimicrobial peptide transport system permease subunit
LPPEITPSRFNADLASFTKKHKPAEYAKDGIILQSLREIHFDSRTGNYNHTFSRQLISTIMTIGVFLIVIACVNFVNLATAQAINRSKEVGVRKVLGSNRTKLIFQFISETAIVTLFAILLAVGAAAAVLPYLNTLLEAKMELNFFRDPFLILFLLLIGLVITLLSGTYPAVILSGFNPIDALQNKIKPSRTGGISLRRGLVVIQFAVAHILIIGTLIVVSQTDFFLNASLGFEKAAIINVPIPSDSASHTKIDYVKAQLLRNPNIQSVSFSYASPSDNGNWNSDFRFDHSPKATNFSANLKWADNEFFNTYRLEFVAGRPYHPSDTTREFVVNETLLKKLGIRDPKDAIGKEINFWEGIKVANIVGVVKDFNVSSLHKPMAPVVLSTWKEIYQIINIKINPSKEKETLSFVEKIWNSSFPDYVYQCQFLDKKIAGFYKQENQLSTLYKIFAGIAIFISCLGLYGLVSFMALQRVKEVGIRKVLGASAANIVYLFSREFSLLVMIAFVIATPIAWYLMHQWLQDFAYRIHPGPGVFLLAIAGSIAIAWLTVGYRAIRAASASPVKSLRTE